ncbi:hypothetical protein GN156_05525 [bacterium LRH843]|nr:hypothetical protein [bacterium LRH843]
MKNLLLTTILIIATLLSACSNEKAVSDSEMNSCFNEEQKYSGFSLPEKEEMVVINHEGLKEADISVVLNGIDNYSIEEVAQASKTPVQLTLLPHEDDWHPWNGNSINDKGVTLGYSSYVYFRDEIVPLYVSYEVNEMDFGYPNDFQIPLPTCTEAIASLVEDFHGEDEFFIAGGLAYYKEGDHYHSVEFRFAEEHQFSETEIKHLLKMIVHSTFGSK